MDFFDYRPTLIGILITYQTDSQSVRPSFCLSTLQMSLFPANLGYLNKGVSVYSKHIKCFCTLLIVILNKWKMQTIKKKM